MKGQKTDGYIVYVMKYVDLLTRNGLIPILVFDGRNLPSKAETEKGRRERRQKYRAEARDHLLAGNYKKATECFQRCIDITPEMAHSTIEACRERNIGNCCNKSLVFLFLCIIETNCNFRLYCRTARSWCSTRISL